MCANVKMGLFMLLVLVWVYMMFNAIGFETGCASVFVYCVCL